MAIIAYQSYSYTEDQASGTSIVGTKPTGLQEGNLMIAQFNISSTNTITPASGFTSLVKTTNNDGTGKFQQIFYKIADAGDVAASNFTFTFSSSGYKRLALLRFSGVNTTDPIGGYTEYASPGSQTGITIPTLTPEIPNTMLLFLQHNGGNTISCSGYAVANSNPTWTEVFDQNNNGGGTSMAYSTLRDASATGNATATLASATYGVAQLVSLNTLPTYQTLTETVTLTELSILYKVTRTFTEILTLTETLLQKISRLWTKRSKPTTIWTKKSKN